MMYIQLDKELQETVKTKLNPVVQYCHDHIDDFYLRLNPERITTNRPKADDKERLKIKQEIKDFQEEKGIYIPLNKALIDPILWRVICGTERPVRPQFLWNKPVLAENGAYRKGWGGFIVSEKNKQGELIETVWSRPIREQREVERPLRLVIRNDDNAWLVKVFFPKKASLKEIKKESSKVSEDFRDHFKQILANQEQILEKLAFLEENQA